MLDIYYLKYIMNVYKLLYFINKMKTILIVSKSKVRKPRFNYYSYGTDL